MEASAPHLILQRFFFKRHVHPEYASVKSGKVYFPCCGWRRRLDNDLAYEKALLLEMLGRSGRPLEGVRIPERPGMGGDVLLPSLTCCLPSATPDVFGNLSRSIRFRMANMDTPVLWAWPGTAIMFERVGDDIVASPSPFGVWTCHEDMRLYAGALFAGLNEGHDGCTAARLAGRYLRGILLAPAIIAPHEPLEDFADASFLSLPKEVLPLAALMHRGLCQLAEDAFLFRRYALVGCTQMLERRGTHDGGRCLLEFFSALQDGQVREMAYYSHMRPGKLLGHLRPLDNDG